MSFPNNSDTNNNSSVANTTNNVKILPKEDDASEQKPEINKSINALKRNSTILPLSGIVLTDAHRKHVKSFEEILEDLGCFGPFQALTLFCYLFLELGVAMVAFIPICITKSSSTFVNCTSEFDDTGLGNVTSTTPSVTTEFLTSTTDLSTTETSSAVTVFQDRGLLDGFQHVWESPFKYESIVDEWNLTCSRAWVTDVFTSCLMAGMIAGNLLWSMVADWYGRRTAYLGLVLVLSAGTFLSAISPKIYIYGIARFIAGSGYSGFINVSCMAVMEFMTPGWRSLANMVGPMGEGIILLSVLGYYIRPWRKLYLVCLTPFSLIIPLYFILPESPRWLLRNKKMKEAHDVLGYMAKINGRQPVSMDVLEALRRQEELAIEYQQKQRISYIDFLKTKHLRRSTMFLFAISFSWNVSYYGISYNIRNFPGSTYFNLGLIGLANAIGQRSSMPASDRFGRRRAVLYGMTLSAVFLVGLAVCFITLKSVNPTVILVGCFVGLFGLSCTRAALRLLSGESFPTAVRTMGLGIGGLGANTAGLLTPQAAYLGSRWPALPFFIFAGISVFGSMVVFKMKETSGTPLTDEINLQNDKPSGNNVESGGQQAK